MYYQIRKERENMEEQLSHISITRSRLNNIIKKRKRRSKRFMVGLLLSSLVGLGVATWLGLLIYDQYQGTKEWSHTKLQGDYATVPPEFVKNTINPQMVNDINELSTMKTIVEEIEKTGIIEKVDDMTTLISKANELFDQYKINSGDMVRIRDNLTLYVQIHKIENSAYKNPDNEKLKDAINKLSAKVTSEDKEGDKQILVRLNTIAEQYTLLNDFISTYIQKLGTIKDDVLTVNDQVDSNLTSEMLTKIDENKLDKFSKIETIKALLTSNDWNTILNNNDSKLRKSNWEKTKSIFDTLSKGQYVQIGSIRTYQDAQKYGHAEIIGAVPKNGYEILSSSNVTSISYEGHTLSNDQYIKKGTTLKIIINPSYNRLPSSSTSSSSTSSTSSTSSSSTSSSTSSSSNHTSQSETRPDQSRQVAE